MAALKIAAYALDCADPRGLAEFYRRLLGWEIDEAESGEDWVELADPDGGASLAFQLDPEHRPSTWPDRAVPQMAHLDFRVATLDEGHRMATEAGAVPLPQPADRLNSTWRVYADPEGHPFCMCAC